MTGHEIVNGVVLQRVGILGASNTLFYGDFSSVSSADRTRGRDMCCFPISAMRIDKCFVLQ